MVHAARQRGHEAARRPSVKAQHPHFGPARIGGLDEERLPPVSAGMTMRAQSYWKTHTLECSAPVNKATGSVFRCSPYINEGTGVTGSRKIVFFSGVFPAHQILTTENFDFCIFYIFIFLMCKAL